RGGDPASELLKFPLGPAFEGNPFAPLAFKHASSAILFGLPNGLQGYLLVDRKGDSTPDAAVGVLVDPQAISGTTQVVTALSCMACHRLGVIGFEDAVRAGHQLPGEPGRKVDQLYRPHLEMELLVRADRRRF